MKSSLVKVITTLRATESLLLAKTKVKLKGDQGETPSLGPGEYDSIYSKGCVKFGWGVDVSVGVCAKADELKLKAPINTMIKDISRIFVVDFFILICAFPRKLFNRLMIYFLIDFLSIQEVNRLCGKRKHTGIMRSYYDGLTAFL